jgi:hypothetical protein
LVEKNQLILSELQFHHVIGTQRLKFLGLSALTTRSFISISVLFIILLFLVLDNCLWLHYTPKTSPISQWLHHTSTLSAKSESRILCFEGSEGSILRFGTATWSWRCRTAPTPASWGCVGHPVNSKSTRFTLTT